jgi:hypothetical protein
MIDVTFTGCGTTSLAVVAGEGSAGIVVGSPRALVAVGVSVT